MIDPAQRIDRVMDIAIQGSKIAAVAEKIPATSADQAIDARGKLVVPGLIDIHVHARDAVETSLAMFMRPRLTGFSMRRASSCLRCAPPGGVASCSTSVTV